MCDPEGKEVPVFVELKALSDLKVGLGLVFRALKLGALRRPLGVAWRLRLLYHHFEGLIRFRVRVRGQG